MNNKKIAVIAAKNNALALATKDNLVKKFSLLDLTLNHAKASEADILVAVGGDGLMLHLLHETEKNPLPIYGVNCGTVGFLMNSFNEEKFLENLAKATESKLHPLRMEAIDGEEKKHSLIAVNEVAVLRNSSQATKIKISVNGQERISCLTADGALVATSAGSTAYNFSAGGAIIPFGAEVLALTAISPFRPRGWSGALLPANSKIKFEIIDYKSRPANVTADSIEVKNVREVEIFEDRSIAFKILFDANHSLEERIIREQFS